MIQFTQFLFPNQKQIKITIERPEEIEDKWQDLVDKGFDFEIENKHGDVWATCIRPSNIDEECDETCDVFGKNDNTVPALIDKLIIESWDKFIWKGL